MSVGSAPPLVAFQSALHTVFQVHGAAPVELELEDVTISRSNPGWESFSLLFAGGRANLPQGSYELAHGQLGTFDLFLVPVLSDREGVHYEAVFNRALPESSP